MSSKSKSKLTSVESNILSTKALRDLLVYIQKKPSEFIDADLLLKSLKSQGGAAKLRGEWKTDIGIIIKECISINTLKKYSDEIFSNGFSEIDDLRKSAIESVENAKEKKCSSNKRTKSGLLKRVNELEDALLKHKQVNFVLLQAISSSMSAIPGVASSSDPEIRRKRADDAIKRLRTIVSLNVPPFDRISRNNSSVVDISEFMENDS